MIRVAAFGAGLSLVFGALSGASAHTGCDGRYFYQLCDYTIEVAAAETAAEPPPKRRPVKRRVVTVAKTETRVQPASGETRLQYAAEEPRPSQTLTAEDAALRADDAVTVSQDVPAAPTVPLALALSLRLTPVPEPDLAADTPACLLERTFNDLRLTSAARTARQSGLAVRDEDNADRAPVVEQRYASNSARLDTFDRVEETLQSVEIREVR